MRHLLGFWLRWCGLFWFALIWFGLGWLGSILYGHIISVDFGSVWLSLIWFGLVWLSMFVKVWFGCPCLLRFGLVYFVLAYLSSKSCILRGMDRPVRKLRHTKKKKKRNKKAKALDSGANLYWKFYIKKNYQSKLDYN